MDPTKVAQVVKLPQVGTLVQAIAKRFAISYYSVRNIEEIQGDRQLV